MIRIKVIVIDDERSAREELKRAIKMYNELEVIGEARNADEAGTLIETHRPHLIFLDIHLPGASGFDLLASLDEVPAVIFTTAYDQYAVKAFEINALDYLMKPVREERFAKAIERVRDRLLREITSGAQGKTVQQIFIKDGDKCHFVRLNELFLIESIDNYTRLHFSDKKALQKRSLRQWEEILDATIFFRISRTHIINTHYISKVNSLANGRLAISLRTGEVLDVSERQSAKFKNLNRI